MEVAHDMREVWDVLSEEEQHEVESQLKVVRVKKNETVYRMGSRPEFIFFLISGRIKVFRPGRNYVRIAIRDHRDNDRLIAALRSLVSQ